MIADSSQLDRDSNPSYEPLIAVILKLAAFVNPYNELRRHTRGRILPKEKRIKELNDIVTGYHQWINDEKIRTEEYRKTEEVILAYFDPETIKGDISKRLKFFWEWLPKNHWIYENPELSTFAVYELGKAWSKKEYEEDIKKQINHFLEKFKHIPGIYIVQELPLGPRRVLELLKELII